MKRCIFDCTLNSIRTRMLRVLGLFILSAFGVVATLQYANAQSACSYVISGPAAGTSVDVGGTSVGLSDDAVTAPLNIGFNFNFFGIVYNQFVISSNGFISFDLASPNGCCTGQVLPNNTTPNNLVAGYWEDLNPGGGGSVGYGVFGTAPARRLVVSYTNVPHYSTGTLATFQIKLHESSNVVEIVNISCPTDGGLHTQGIDNLGGTVAFVPSGRNSTSFSSTNETTTFTPVDATIPSITCPANISVPCTQAVTFSNASGTDNCSFARSTQVVGLPSGATFPVGTNTVTFRARDHGSAGVFANGAGGTFSYNEGDSPQTIALKACESVYGTGNCVVGACGSFTYYYRSGHLTCNCGKTAGQYEFVYGNAGYSDVGQDYGGTNAPVSYVPFVRVKGPNGCSIPNTWLLSNDRLGGNFNDCSFTVTVGTGVTTANAGPDQTVCGSSVTLAANTPSVGAGSWSVVAGAGGTVTTPSNPSSGFTGVPGTTYTLRWTIAQAPCASSTDDVIITLRANPTAAGAGPDQSICGNSGTLAGNTPTIGTGSWSIIAGAGGGIVAPTSPNSTVFGATGTTYTLRWTISNAPCVATTDDVLITFVGTPTTANAGPDQTICGAAATLAGNSPTMGSGSWSIVSGAGGTVTTPASPTSGFTGVPGTIYTLRWTIANVPCVASFDDVIITLRANPTTSNAGPDQTICTTTTTLAANTPTSGTGTWSIVSGAGGSLGTPTNPASGFTGVSGTTYTLRWTIANAPCVASTDDVVIAMTAGTTVANAGPDVNTCASSTTLAGNTPSSGAGAWTILSGVGGSVTTPSSPTSAFTGVSGNTYTLRWTITNPPCAPTTDDVIITFTGNPTVANAGPDQTICGTTTTLAGNAPTTGTGVWSIVSGTGGVITTPSSPTSTFTCTPGQTYTLRWTTLNPPCANTTDEVEIITDLVGPAISCPSNVLTNNDVNACGATVNYTTPVGTDNCPSPTTTLTSGLASGSLFPIGSTTNVFTVSDGTGNTATCAFLVDVADNQAPAITCPSNVSVGNNLGQCDAVVTYATPVGTDNCPSATTALTVGFASGATFPLGGTTVTYAVTDAAGNSTTCSFVVTVTDSEAPAITCPANITVNNDLGLCTAVATYSTPSGTDNCAGFATTQLTGLASGATYPVGATTNTFRVTDAAGNSTTCAFSVTVNDIELPAISCPSSFTLGTDLGACTALISYPPVNGADNCSGATTVLTAGLPTGSAFPVGATTCAFTVTDASGNTATCSFTATVIDNELPTIVCPPNTNVSTSTISCDTTLSYSPPTVADNCVGGSLTLTSGIASGGTFPLGVTTNTFLATDGGGNSATCSFTVTVADQVSPVITCPAPLSLTASVGACGATVSFTSPVGTDNCSGANTTQVQGLASGATFPVGVTANSFLVTDGAGNSSACSFTVTIVDNELPTVNCPSASTVNTSVGSCTASPTFTTPVGLDNCAGVTISQTTGLPSGSAIPVGINNNTFVVTDASGNSATCSFAITVTDVELPTITCPANISTNTDLGVCTATVTYTTPVGADNCVSTTVLSSGLSSGATFPVGATTNTYQVTDASGNSATCAFTVTVSDNILPTWASCPSSIVVGTSTNSCTGTATWTAPTASDNCSVSTSNSSHAPGNTFNLGATTVIYTAADAAGNTATCAFLVTVNDSLSPNAVCQNAVVNLDSTGNGSLNAAAVDNGSTDNCAVASLTLSQTTFTCANSGVTNLVLIVADSSGNTDSCTATVTVTPPTVTATASADTANCGFNVSCFGGIDGVAQANASGGCPTFTYLWSNGATTSAATGLAAGTYTCTVTDGAGSTQVVTVTLTQPTAMQATATSTQSCPGDPSGSIDLTVSGGNDCQGYSFLWSTGATTEDLSNVAAGDYIVTMTDAGGCSLIDTVTVGAFPAPNPTFTVSGNLLTSAQVWSSYQWLLNGSNISGATASTFLATQTGSYALLVTDANGCEGTSDTTNITIVGIADAMGDWADLSIYPNPARDEFRLRTLSPIGYSLTVSIHDMFGKRYAQEVLPELSLERGFDLKAFSAGTYIVEVVSEFGQRKLFRLVVQ